MEDIENFLKEYICERIINQNKKNSRVKYFLSPSTEKGESDYKIFNYLVKSKSKFPNFYLPNDRYLVSTPDGDLTLFSLISLIPNLQIFDTNKNCFLKIDALCSSIEEGVSNFRNLFFIFFLF